MAYSQQLFAQKDNFPFYFESIINARNQFDEQKYEDSKNSFESAFLQVKIPLAKDLEKATEVASRLNDMTLVQRFSRIMAENYGRIPRLKYFTNEAIYNKLNIELKSQILFAESKFDMDYIEILDSLILDDQALRTNGPIHYPNGINTDSIRTIYLISLIEERGFPNERKVGLWGYNSAISIIKHADFDLHNKYLGDIMHSNVMNGDMLASNYAEIIDRRCNYRHEPYYYYQVPMGYQQLSKEEKQKITARRNKIGLRSVDQTSVIEVTPGGDVIIKPND